MKTKAQLIGKIGWLSKNLSDMKYQLEQIETSNWFLRNDLRNVQNGMPNLRDLQRENVSLREQVEYLKGRLGELPLDDQAIFDSQQTPLEFTVTH